MMNNVLIVDSQVARRSMLRGRMEDLGFRVAGVEESDEGLRAVEERDFDLVLVGDDVSGAQLCREIKSKPGIAPHVIVYSQTESVEEIAERAYDAGCDRFLSSTELASLERVAIVLLQNRQRVDASREHRRMLECERQRLVAVGSPGIAEPQCAGARPDAILIIDNAGIVRSSDPGAHRIFGKELEGRPLDDLAPGRGLQALIRDARRASIEGLRFDLPDKPGRPVRHYQASIYPVHATLPREPRGNRVVLLVDIGRRMIADDLLRTRACSMTQRQVESLVETASVAYGPHSIVGESDATRALRHAVVAEAGRTEPVLIHGARGTRRREVARALHYAVEQAGPFLVLHCAALSTESLESELFGVAGGESDRDGLVTLAAGGSLLCEEVESLPLTVQERLARMLEEGSFTPVGTTTPRRLEARILVTSTRDFDGLRRRNALIPSFFRALGTSAIHVPTLVERAADLPSVIKQVLNRVTADDARKVLAPEVLWLLQHHDWPRNHDELEETLRDAFRRAPGERIGIEHLDLGLRRAYAELSARGVAPEPRTDVVSSAGETWYPEATRSSHEWDVTDDDPISFDAYERKVILRALDACGGDKLAVARMLKIGKSTLYRKLHKLSI
ncbi:MAG: response regulator [bacterium]|nr:response regulator [bacterium]